MTVLTVTVVIFVTLVIVTVATVAEGTVVIVTYLSKNNLTPQQQMRYSQGRYFHTIWSPCPHVWDSVFFRPPKLVSALDYLSATFQCQGSGY